MGRKGIQVLPAESPLCAKAWELGCPRPILKTERRVWPVSGAGGCPEQVMQGVSEEAHWACTERALVSHEEPDISWR